MSATNARTNVLGQRAAMWLLASLVVVGAACRAPPEPVHRCLESAVPPGPLVAQVGPVTLTVEELGARARAQGPAGLRVLQERQELRRFVEDQIRLELLAEAALDRGLARDPEVVATARKAMAQRLLAADLAPHLADAESLSDGPADRAKRTELFEAYIAALRKRYPVTLNEASLDAVAKEVSSAANEERP